VRRCKVFVEQQVDTPDVQRAQAAASHDRLTCSVRKTLTSCTHERRWAATLIGRENIDGE
jgi:hypothetical protein